MLVVVTRWNLSFRVSVACKTTLYIYLEVNHTFENINNMGAYYARLNKQLQIYL